jgi:hypothetical protein
MRRLWVTPPRYFKGIVIDEYKFHVVATSVRKRVLRALGRRPDVGSIVDELEAAFGRAADAEEEPERRTRLRGMADGLRGFGHDVAVEAISSKFSGLS